MRIESSSQIRFDKFNRFDNFIDDALAQKMVKWIIIELVIKRLLMETSKVMYFFIAPQQKNCQRATSVELECWRWCKLSFCLKMSVFTFQSAAVLWQATEKRRMRYEIRKDENSFPSTPEGCFVRSSYLNLTAVLLNSFLLHQGFVLSVFQKAKKKKGFRESF